MAWSAGLVASANFSISAAIAPALLAQFSFVHARRSQLSALASVGCVTVVVMVYSDAARLKFDSLREQQFGNFGCQIAGRFDSAFARHARKSRY